MVRWTSPGSRWTISMPSVAMTCCRAKLARTRSRKLGSGGWNTSQSLPANDDVRQETLSSSANDGNSHCWTGRSASRQLGLEERHGAGAQVGMEGRAIFASDLFGGNEPLDPNLAETAFQSYQLFESMVAGALGHPDIRTVKATTIAAMSATYGFALLRMGARLQPFMVGDLSERQLVDAVLSLRPSKPRNM